MLQAENTTMNMFGTVYNNERTLANLDGSFDGGAGCHLNINIPNYNEVILNKELFYADLEDFLNQLLEKIVDLQQ